MYDGPYGPGVLYGQVNEMKGVSFLCIYEVTDLSFDLFGKITHVEGFYSKSHINIRSSFIIYRSRLFCFVKGS